MEEYIIASGADISQYIRSSNKTYSCKVSGGIGIKKNGYVELNVIPCENIFISIRKISGNGKFNIKYGNVSQDMTAFNMDKIFISQPTLVRIERTLDAIGDISVLFIGCVLEDNMSLLLKELSKCNYNGIRVIDNKIIANVNGYISDFKQSDYIETIPEKCYIIQGNRITFPIQCLISKLKINNTNVINNSDLIEEIIQKDSERSKLMEAYNVTKTTAPTVAINKITQNIIPEFSRRVIYNANESSYSNLIRKIGGYKLLTNKNKKILSLYASSEIQIPITISESNYYCIETSARSGSRSFCQYYIGLDSGVIQKSEVRCSTNIGTNKFYINIDAPNKACKIILGLNKKQKDYINIHELKIFEISLDEYLENTSKNPSRKAIENFINQEALKNSIDLKTILNTLKLNIPDEDKMLSLSLSGMPKNIHVDIEKTENIIESCDNFILFVGMGWSAKDNDMFNLMTETYNIEIIRVPHYNYDKDHFAYLATKAQNIICDVNMINDVKLMLCKQETLLNKLFGFNVKYQDAFDKVVKTKFEKPKYTFEEFVEAAKPVIEQVETPKEIVSAYSDEDIRFKIVIPSFNNSKWISKTLESIAMQDYKKYDVCIVDDFSTENKGRETIQSYCEKYNSSFNKWEYIFNNQRKNSLFNIVNGIKNMKCNDEDVIVNIDGDDWLLDEKVLSKVNNVYKAQKVYMTYGQYTFHPTGKRGHCKQIPQRIKANNSYRSYEWNMSHLRTYKYLLFKNIKEEDFLDENKKYYIMAGDLALMFPMAELSGGKIAFIDDILYVYNRATNLNDDKVNVQKQLSSASSIRKKQKYKPIV